MKKISYIFAILFTIILLIPHVNAECTSEELEELKTKAEEIRVTYEHLGKIYTEEDGESYDFFDIKIKNIPNDFYAVHNGVKLVPEDLLVETKMPYGNKEIIIYSNKCEEKLKTITFKLPRFNMYSLDPLCEGIDGDDFTLCGKYYDYDVSYENFVKRVTNYKNTHQVSDEKKDNNEKSIFDVLLKIVQKNVLYIGIGVIFLVFVILLILLIKKRRKRGVLE